MDFELSPTAADHVLRMQAFMVEEVFPAEAEYERFRRAQGPDDHTLPPLVEELKR